MGAVAVIFSLIGSWDTELFEKTHSALRLIQDKTSHERKRAMSVAWRLKHGPDLARHSSRLAAIVVLQQKRACVIAAVCLISQPCH